MKAAVKFALFTLGLLTANSLFGGSAVVNKIAVNKESLNAFFLVLVRNVFATPILIALTYAVERPKRFLPETGDYFSLVALGVTGHFLNQFFATAGVIYTNAVNASLAQQTIPVITLIMSVILKRETINFRTMIGWFKLIGIFLSISGAIIVTILGGRSSSEKNTSADIYLGNFYFMVNTFSYSFYLLIQQSLLKRYSPIHLSTLCAASGSILLIFIALPQIVLGYMDNWYPSPMAWGAIVYFVIAISVVGFTIVTKINMNAGPTFVTAFIPFQCVASGIMSSIVFGYEFNVGDWIGAGLSFAGLYFVVFGKYKDVMASNSASYAPLKESNPEGPTTEDVESPKASVEEPSLEMAMNPQVKLSVVTGEKKKKEDSSTTTFVVDSHLDSSSSLHESHQKGLTFSYEAL